MLCGTAMRQGCSGGSGVPPMLTVTYEEGFCRSCEEADGSAQVTIAVPIAFVAVALVVGDVAAF